MSKREQIIAAIVAACATLGATVERDTDTPEVVPTRGLVIVRSAAPEIDDETLGAARSWYMRLAVPIEVYVTGDASTRAERLDVLMAAVAAALTGDAALLALSAYIEPTIVDIEAIAGDGRTTFAAAQMTARVEYDSASPIG